VDQIGILLLQGLGDARDPRWQAFRDAGHRSPAVGRAHRQESALRPLARRKGKVTREPLVSAIIIFLNEKRFIQEAIESVLAQHYQHWELFLVDDGSTDASTAIALHYANQYAGRVRYLSHLGHQNRGMSASRNLGLMHATGRYVSYLDADDIWLPQKLEQQVALLEAHSDCAFVYGAKEFWFSWTGRPEDYARNQVKLELGGIQPDAPVAPPKLLTAFLVNEGVSPTGALMRRDSMEAVGGYEEPFRGLYEDQVLYAKLCLEAPVFVASTRWFRYRRHKDSCVMTANRTGQKYVFRHRFLIWLEQYLSQRGMEQSEVWSAVQNELSTNRYLVLQKDLDRFNSYLEL